MTILKTLDRALGVTIAAGHIPFITVAQATTAVSDAIAATTESERASRVAECSRMVAKMLARSCGILSEGYFHSFTLEPLKKGTKYTAEAMASIMGLSPKEHAELEDHILNMVMLSFSADNGWKTKIREYFSCYSMIWAREAKKTVDRQNTDEIAQKLIDLDRNFKVRSYETSDDLWAAARRTISKGQN